MTLLLGLVVLCFAWLAPGHFHPWINFQNAWAAAAGAVLIACAALSPRPDRRVRWPTLAVLTLVVALVPLIQLWAGQIRFVSDAALAALHLAGFALAMVAGATLVRQRGTELIGGLF